MEQKKKCRRKWRIIVLMLLCGILTACAGNAGARRWKELTAKNEIVTYQKLSKDKITLIVSVTGNISIKKLCDAFANKNPEIQIVNIDITGVNKMRRPVIDLLESGQAPDIMFLAENMVGGKELVDYFIDLSNHPVVTAYQAEALIRNAVNSKIYLLPGPSKVECMVYNKTLFEQYGWKVPETNEEFIALCLQITEDSQGTIEAWNPNAKYSNDFNVAMQGLLYGELFAGVENRTWYNEFCMGNAQYTGHMEPMYEMIQTLIDHNILREEHFSYSATTRRKEFGDGKIAMINHPVDQYDNEEYKYSYFPFPGKSKETSYMSDFFSFNAGVVKKEYSKEETEAINCFLEFLSSTEGQEILIGDTMMVSNVKEAVSINNQYLSVLQPVINGGRMFTRLTFNNEEGNAIVSFHADAQKILTGEKTAEECIAAADRSKVTPQNKVSDEPENLATVAEDFSILELSFYYADMYKEKAGAEIGLIVNNEAFRGNLYRIFNGELTKYDVTVMKPRSFDNGSTLVRAKMTGAQLLDALNHPRGNEKTADAVYAYSGLRCEIAPWNPLGEKYLSIKLADGTAIDTEKMYTVAFWAGTVFDEYITEVEQIEGTFEEILTEKLLKDKTLTPINDGRIKLVWK